MDELEQKLCEVADLLMKRYNPCRLNGNVCLAGDPNPCCYRTRFGPNKCPFLGSKGCIKNNIACKTWFCMTAVKQMSPECFESFKHLERLAKIYGYIMRPYLGHSNYVGADKLNR